MTNETITTNDPRLAEGVWIIGPDGQLQPDYDATFPTINEGEVVHGVVVRVDKDEVLVDIGYKSEGVIPVSELSIRRAVNPADELACFAKVWAMFRDLRAEIPEGYLFGIFRPPLPCGVGACSACMVRQRGGTTLVCADGPALDLIEVPLT